MNPHWNRWILSSIAKHFYDKSVIDVIPFYLEGAPLNTLEHKDWIELRIDGPLWSGRTKDQWGCKVEVNVLLSSAKDHHNNYRIHVNSGKVCAMFTQIGIFKLGDGPDDDQSFITCLRLITEGKEQLEVHQFGQIDPTVQLLQCSVEGHYHANLGGE